MVLSLPVSVGHWLPSSECRAYRKPCPLAADGRGESQCVATYEACGHLPDLEQAGEFVPPRVGDVTCQERSFVQPCDWQVRLRGSKPGILYLYSQW